MRLKLRSGKKLKKCNRLNSLFKINAYWVSKYKAIVCKNAIAFFIRLLLSAGYFCPQDTVGLQYPANSLKKLLEQKKHCTYSIDFYKHLLCYKPFCCKAPYQQSPGTGIWFKCSEGWYKCTVILGLIFIKACKY